MDDQQLGDSFRTLYGTMIAHRQLLQFLLAKRAEAEPEPIAVMRDIIEKTIISLTNVSQNDGGAFSELLQKAAEELELIGDNVETRLSALADKGPPEG